MCLNLVCIQAQAQYLDDYLKEASKNSPLLKASYARFESALTQVDQVKALSDPQLSFGYFISPIETRVGAQQARISLTQQFPWFGTLDAKADQTKQLAQVEFQRFLDDKNELLMKVKQAYYPLYEIQKKIEIQQSQIELLQSKKQILTTRLSTGKTKKSDLIQLDIKLEELQFQKKLHADKIPSLTIQFNRFLNRADSSKVLIMDTLTIDKTLLSLEDQINLNQNPQMKALSHQLEAMKKSEVIAQKQGLPNFSIGIDYAFIGEREGISITDNGKDAIMPMISMSIPIFRSKYNAAKKQAKLKQEATQHQMIQLEDDLFSKIEELKYQMGAAAQTDAFLIKQFERAKQIKELITSEYSSEQASFLDLIQSEDQILDIKLKMMTNTVAFKLAEAKFTYLLSSQSNHHE